MREKLQRHIRKENNIDTLPGTVIQYDRKG